MIKLLVHIYGWHLLICNKTDHPSLQLNLHHDALEPLLNYAYTNQCSLTLNNVFRIIQAAQLCQMTNLFEYCCDYLAQNLNQENIFYFYQFAKANSHLKLFDVTYDYLM